MSNIKSKIMSGLAWESVTKLIIQIASWTSTVLVARLLTPEDYGIVAVSGVFVGLLLIIADMGLGSGLVNKKDLNKNEVTGIFWFSFLIGGTSSIILIVLSPAIESYFQMPGLASIVAVSSVVLIISSLKCVPVSLVSRALNYKLNALINLYASFSQIIVTLTFAYLDYGAWSLIYGTVAMQIVQLAAYTPILIKNVNFNIAFKFHEIQEIIMFGANVMASRVLHYFTSASPTFFTGIMLGQKAAGHFSFASQIAQIPINKIGAIFNRVLFPAISRIKDDTSYAKTVFFKLHRTLLTISFPILIGLIITAPDLVVILFTEKWNRIIYLLQLICLINILRISLMVFTPILEGIGKPNIVLKYNIFTAATLPAASFIGLNWGTEGMVTSWFFVYPLLYMYLLVSLSRVLEFSLIEFIRSFKSVIVSSLVMTITLISIGPILQNFAILERTLATIVSGAIVYTLSYFIFFKNEISEIKRNLNRA